MLHRTCWSIKILRCCADRRKSLQGRTRKLRGKSRIWTRHWNQMIKQYEIRLTEAESKHQWHPWCLFSLWNSQDLLWLFHSEEATLPGRNSQSQIHGPVIYPSQSRTWNTMEHPEDCQWSLRSPASNFQQLRICQTSASLALICQTSHFWSETELLIEVLVRVSQLTMNRLWIELTGVIEVAFDTSSSMTILNIGSNRGWPCDGFHTCENT